MESPIFQPVNTPVEQLDTPSLVVDLSIMEHNIEKLHSFFRQHDARVRPHIGSHKSPAIAHKQLAAGGTVYGIAVTTVGEAEVFAQHGFTDIFIANVVVTPQKICRMCSLARHAIITVATDNPKNVHDLSAAAQETSVVLKVVVDVHTRLERCGVEPGRPAADLASAVTKAKNLHFAGLMTYEGMILTDDTDELICESRNCIQLVLDTRHLIEKAGTPVEVVSVGGTHNYEIAGAMAGVTEVLASSYVLSDYRYSRYRTQFKPAAKVLSTVSSHPEPGIAIIDSGEKSVGNDQGLPMIDRIPSATLMSLSAEHGIVKLERDAQSKVNVGDKLWLVPWDISSCVNLHDYIHMVREDKLEAVWEIAARGRYR